MADGPRYESHLSREVVGFVTALPKKQQKRVLDLADQIAQQPSLIGDYQTFDSVGRAIENLRLEQYLFSYWVDHGSREVRIVEIARL